MPHRPHRTPFAAIACLAAALSLAACAVPATDGGASSAAGAPGLVGDPAPPFRVRAETGSRATIALDDLRGRVVLVDFWGTFCEPCKRSFPKLEELSREYAARGLSIIAISEDEPEDRAKIPAFAAALGAKFPVAWDGDKAVAGRYEPETMPSSFLIDRRGVVRFEHVGFHDGDEARFRREIEELLAP